MSTEPYQWHYDYSRIAWDTGFHFNDQKSQQAFDRNGIALLDIERIIRERDIRIVEHHVQNILEYNLDSEEARILDPNFVKLFRLSQLAVEYLIYCKKYLDTTVNTIKNDLQKVNNENDDLKHDLIYYQNEVHKLKKKVKDLKSTLQMVQKYQPVGFTNESMGTFQCTECNKIFVNSEYLKAHILRRHPNNDQDILFDTANPESAVNQINTTPVHTQYKEETDRLQMEIKELKEKLNNTERYFQNEDQKQKNEHINGTKHEGNVQNIDQSKSEEYGAHIQTLHEQFELLKLQIESEMEVLKEKKNEHAKYDKMMEQIILKLDEKGTYTAEQKKEQIPIKTVVDVHKENKDKEIQVELDVQLNNIEELYQKENKTISETKEDSETFENNIPHREKKLNDPKIGESSGFPSKITECLIKKQSSTDNVLVDISKVKEDVGKDLEEKTKKNMEKLGEEITEKMSLTFGKVQERLELFWNKLQEFEKERENQIFINKIEKEQMRPYVSSSNTITAPKSPRSINISSLSSDLDSDTESSKQEIIQRPSRIIPVQKNEKVPQNLISELKTALHEKNKTNIKIPDKDNTKHVSIYKTMDSTLNKPRQVFLKQVKSSSESESESEESETTSEVDKSCKAIQFTAGARTTSAGESTLRNKSNESLQNILYNNPQILETLKHDLNELLSDRLNNLGIDPKWIRISDKTFQEKAEIIAYQRTMIAKNIKSFMDIRENIVTNLEDRIKGLNHTESPTTSPAPDTKTSRFKSIFVNMRNKAKHIIKSEKSTPNQTPNKSIYKLTIHKSLPQLLTFRRPDAAVITKRNISPNKVDKPKQEILKSSKPIMYETDSDNSETTSEHLVQPIPVERSKKLIRKSKSDSSMEVLDLSDQKQSQKNVQNTPVPAARSMDSILEMKKELKSQLIDSSVHSSVESVNPINKNESSNINMNKRFEALKPVEINKTELEDVSSDDSSDELMDEKVQKSVLKNTATIGGSKKKVFFDLHSDEKTAKETNENDQKPTDVRTIQTNSVKKTIVKPNILFKNNEWNDSSSIDSSIVDFNKKHSKENLKEKEKISTKAVINVATKQNLIEDISDFDISDLN